MKKTLLVASLTGIACLRTKLGLPVMTGNAQLTI